MEKIKLSWEKFHKDVDLMLQCLYNGMHDGPELEYPHEVYGIPTGGSFVAQHMASKYGLKLLESPEPCCMIVDDVVDSGDTFSRVLATLPKAKYFTAAVYRKPHSPLTVDAVGQTLEGWIEFPWETNHPSRHPNGGPEDAIIRILSYIGEDPSREGLKETPARVIKSYGELFAGYQQDPKTLMKVFTEGACDELVLLKDIEVFSCCEHHMLPFTGVAHVAYIPNKRIVGISKLARLVEIYARRLQVQERLTVQITKALDEHLQPLGSACILEARHMCMSCRGVGKQNAKMVTSSLTGEFRNHEVRQELLSLIYGRSA